MLTGLVWSGVMPVQVQIEEEGGWQPWSLVSRLDTSKLDAIFLSDFLRPRVVLQGELGVDTWWEAASFEPKSIANPT